MTAPDDLLTAGQVCQLLNIDAATLYRWRIAGTAPASYRLGTKLRFKRADVDAWLAARRSEEATA